MEEAHFSLSLSSRLFGAGSTLLQTIEGPPEKSLIDEVFRFSSIHEAKPTCMCVLARLMYSSRGKPMDGRIFLIIDSIPSLIDSGVGNGSSIQEFIQSCIDNGDEDLHSRLSINVGKISSACLRSIKRRDSFSAVSFSVLDILANSLLRNSLFQSVQTIRDHCNSLLSDCMFSDLSSSLLSSLDSFDSAELWGLSFVTRLQQLTTVLLLMGIHLPGVVKESIPGWNEAKSHWRACPGGHSKSIMMERTVGGLCTLLENMVSNGCSAGPVQLNISLLLAILAGLLPLKFEWSGSDPKWEIENEFGIAPADLCSVSSQLKIHVLRILQAVLDTGNPILQKSASAVYIPLSNAILMTESRQVPKLSLALIKCINSCCRLFPSLIGKMAALSIQGGGGGVAHSVPFSSFRLGCGASAIVSLFCEVVVYSTRQFQNISSLSPGDSVGAHTDLFCQDRHSYEQIFKCVESMLVFCGRYLPNEMREIIRSAIAEGLMSICRGSVPVMLPNRHLKRSLPEPLRETSSLQILLLNLCSVEVMSPPSLGSEHFSSDSDSAVSYGTLIGLFKSAALCCLGQPQTEVDAARALLLIDTILNPSAITLPTARASSFLDSIFSSSGGSSVYSKTSHSSIESAGQAASVLSSSTRIQSSRYSFTEALGNAGSDNFSTGRIIEESEYQLQQHPLTESTARSHKRSKISLGTSKNSAGSDDDDDDDNDIPDINMN